MTHKEEIKYLQMALKIQGLDFCENVVDKILTTYQTLKQKEEKMSLKDVAEINNYIEKTYGI